MSSVVKGNRPLRIFAGLVVVLLVISHFIGQVDLSEISFLWLIIAMGLNAFQASFSGFCPMFKNAKGECVACGVACDSADNKADCCSDKEQSSCCSTAADCCADGSKNSGCCSSESDSKACCDDQKTADNCCSNESKGAGCCGADTQSTQPSGRVIKVLGSGCANCDSTAKLIAQVAEEQGVSIQLLKVEDFAEIAAYGVMSTPAVVIDEQVKHSGSIPSKQQIEQWLQP